MREVLAQIHNIATQLENKKAFKQADKLNNIFIKIAAEVEAAKKKKKTKKNVPNNPALWAACKAWAKRTFDIYPSAYSNGAAAKRYKAKGGTWRKASSDNRVITADDKLNKIMNLIDKLEEKYDDSALDEIEEMLSSMDESEMSPVNHDEFCLEGESTLEDALNNYDSNIYKVDPHGDWREDEWISIEEYIELLERKYGDNIMDAAAAVDENHIAFDSPDGFQVINLVHKSMWDTGTKGPLPGEDD